MDSNWTSLQEFQEPPESDGSNRLSSGPEHSSGKIPLELDPAHIKSDSTRSRTNKILRKAGSSSTAIILKVPKSARDPIRPVKNPIQSQYGLKSYTDPIQPVQDPIQIRYRSDTA
eukprot:7879459-Pyramimonas_sp.AAC.1